MGIKGSHYQHEKTKGRVRWNEANLREIEANKPVRKKIDEPKTPYPPMIEEDGSPSIKPDNSADGYAAHAEALRNALNKLTSSEKRNNHVGKWTSSDEEGFAERRDAVSFEERRRAHYGEFKRVKETQVKDFFLNDEHDNGIHDSGIAREIAIRDSDEILQVIVIEENDDLSFPQYPQLLN